MKEFEEFCKYQRSLSENTVRGYRWDLKQFSEWVKDREIEITLVKIRDVDSFLISLRKEGRSAKTINRKIYCLRAFYRWLQRIEIINRSPVEFLTNIREPKRLPKYLSCGKQEALLKASNYGAHHHPNKWGSWLKDRDNLMILLLLDTGLRISELCAIRKSDIDLEQGTLRVFGKGQKERQVILSDRCISAIRECLKNGNGSDDIVFFNQQKRHLNTRHAWRIVQEIGERAGIENLHPHLLRSTYATNLRRRGADLQIIQQALGHASIVTTTLYSHIEDQDYRKKLKELIN